jgi:hypothetical protein
MCVVAGYQNLRTSPAGLWSGIARYAKRVNGTLNLTRVSYDRQFESDPPSVSAVLPARGKNGDQTFSSSLTFGFAACGLAMMPARRLSLSL